MLVLSRRENESIRIGDDIELIVIRIGRNAVRLGITAPRHVDIVRTEVDDGRPAPAEAADWKLDEGGES